MTSVEDNVEKEAKKASEEAIKLELYNNQIRENIRIKEALKKQKPWRGLIED